MTPEQLRRVHVALEQCGGKVAPAASLLGLSPQGLKAIIRENPELASYRKDAQPPTDAETLARPALAVTKEESAIVEAVEKADAQVREGFQAIGVTGDALTQAIAFRDFGKMHFASMRHFIGGGVAKLFADLVADVQKVRVDIDDPSNKLDVELQKVLREDRSRLVKMALECYDRTREAALTAAVIEAKKQEAKADRKKIRPAFAPLAVKCETLVVNEQKPPSQQQPDSDRAV